MKRLAIIAACLIVVGCSDSVDRAARSAYELTLRSPSDGSGYSMRREAFSRVATWQVRMDASWDAYEAWVRPRLLREFDDVAIAQGHGLVSRKDLGSDTFTLELSPPEPPQLGYATATFTARPF